MVTTNNNYSRFHKYYYENCVSNKCEQICCSDLTDGLCNLYISSKNSNCLETVLNLSSHPNSTTIITKLDSTVIPENTIPLSRRGKRKKRKKRKRSPEPPYIFVHMS